MSKSMCECFLGYVLHPAGDEGYPLYKSGIREVLQEYVEEFNEYSCTTITTIDVIDNLEGRGFIFKYCPQCGEEIDWETIKGELQGE